MRTVETPIPGVLLRARPRRAVDKRSLQFVGRERSVREERVAAPRENPTGRVLSKINEIFGEEAVDVRESGARRDVVERALIAHFHWSQNN